MPTLLNRNVHQPARRRVAGNRLCALNHKVHIARHGK